MKVSNNYWTHNVAYHNWVLKQIKNNDVVLDVGCGDGLLVQKISSLCKKVTGIEVDFPCVQKANKRIENISNAKIIKSSFEKADIKQGSIDVIVFVASIHHMDMQCAIKKAKSLLAPNGRIIIVGCAKSERIFDIFLDMIRVIPAKIGSIVHGEKNGGLIGVPTKSPQLSYREVYNIIFRCLRGAKIRRGLYYRYLMTWDNIDT